LSTAAHLQGYGLKVAIFGKPLQLWREHMPMGMLLRSYWWATNLSDPEKMHGLEQYFIAEGQHESDPFPIEAFIDYGLWFQKHVVVIGGGQSALETAALLNENGVEVELVTRSPLRWLSGDSLQNRTLIKRLRYPKAGIAPGWFNWGLEYFPYAFQRLPRSTKD